MENNDLFTLLHKTKKILLDVVNSNGSDDTNIPDEFVKFNQSYLEISIYLDKEKVKKKNDNIDIRKIYEKMVNSFYKYDIYCVNRTKCPMQYRDADFQKLKLEIQEILFLIDDFFYIRTTDKHTDKHTKKLKID